jgi:hypothetical protein
MKVGDMVRIQHLRSGMISPPVPVVKVTDANIFVSGEDLDELDKDRWCFGWGTKKFRRSDLEEWRLKQEPRFKLLKE